MRLVACIYLLPISVIFSYPQDTSRSTYGSFIEKRVGGYQDIGESSVIIPRLDIEIPIVEGDSDDVMVNGMWLRPGSAKPDQEGNIIMAGHRLRVGKPLRQSLFYADKLVPGDEIYLRWQNRLYLFFVVTVTIVSATDSRTELPLLEKTLTLYTCTPLWSSDKRLIIKAKPP
jgi:sortase A